MTLRNSFLIIIIFSLIRVGTGLAETDSDIKPLGPPTPDQKSTTQNNKKAPPDFQADQNIIAQQPQFPEYMKWPVIYAHDMIFTPQRTAENVEHVSDHFSMLTYDDIMKLPARDLDEAIAFIPGVTVEQTGNIGQPAQAQIGGGLARQVRVIFDDLTFNTTTEGTTDLSQFPIEAVGKVEVVKGPSSSTWGSALSGVINMFTKPVGDSLVPHGEATYAWGDFNTDRRYFDVAQKVGPAAYFLSGSLVDSAGFRPNSDVAEKRLYTKIEIDLLDGLKFKGSFGYFGQNNSEFEDYVSLVKPTREVITRFGRMGFELTPTDWITLDARVKFVVRHFNTDQFDLTPGLEGELVDNSQGDSIVTEGSIKADIRISEKQGLTFGTDDGEQTVRAQRQTLGVERFNVRDSAYAEAYYANYHYYFKYLDIVLGSRFDNNNAFGHQYSPSAGWVIHLPFIRSNWKFNFERAFNAPPFADRFVSSAGLPGIRPLEANPEIKAERATAYSIAWAFNPFAWFGLETTFYQNFVRDGIVIEDVDGIPGGPATFKNISRERRDGVDGELHFRPFGKIDFLYAINYVKVLDGSKGLRPVHDRPLLSQDLGFTVTFPFDIFWTMRGKWIDTNRDTTVAIPADRRFMFDTKIFWRWPKIVYGNVSCYLQISNMFNTDYSFDSIFNPNPRRQVEFGLRYEF